MADPKVPTQTAPASPDPRRAAPVYLVASPPGKPVPDSLGSMLGSPTPAAAAALTAMSTRPVGPLATPPHRGPVAQPTPHTMRGASILQALVFGQTPPAIDYGEDGEGVPPASAAFMTPAAALEPVAEAIPTPAPAAPSKKRRTSKPRASAAHIVADDSDDEAYAPEPRRRKAPKARKRSPATAGGSAGKGPRKAARKSPSAAGDDGPNKPRSSRFLGVSWSRSGKRWIAQLYHDSKKVYIGCFGDEEEAARAYDEKARKIKGPNAPTNFTRDGDLANAGRPMAMVTPPQPRAPPKKTAPVVITTVATPEARTQAVVNPVGASPLDFLAVPGKPAATVAVVPFQSAQVTLPVTMTLPPPLSPLPPVPAKRMPTPPRAGTHTPSTS